jgi:hypothetical protein
VVVVQVVCVLGGMIEFGLQVPLPWLTAMVMPVTGSGPVFVTVQVVVTTSPTLDRPSWFVSATAEVPVRVSTGASAGAMAALEFLETVGATFFATALGGVAFELPEPLPEEADDPPDELEPEEPADPEEPLGAELLEPEELVVVESEGVGLPEVSPELAEESAPLVGVSAAIAAPLTSVTTQMPATIVATTAMARGRRERRTARSRSAATRETCMEPLTT